MHDDFGDLVALAAVHVHAARPDAHVLSRTAEKGKSREYKTKLDRLNRSRASVFRLGARLRSELRCKCSQRALTPRRSEMQSKRNFR